MAMATHQVSNVLVVVALTLAASAVFVNVVALLRSVIWEPLKQKRIMERQGVRGPPFRFLVGNLPEAAALSQSFPEALPLDDTLGDFPPTVTPQYVLYFPKYGQRFLYWWGSETRLVVRKPEMVKKVLDGVKLGGAFERSFTESLIDSTIVGRECISGMGRSGSWRGRLSTRSFTWKQEIPFPDMVWTLRVSRSSHGDLCRSLPAKQNKLMAQLDAKLNHLTRELVDSRREAAQQKQTSSYGNDLMGRMLAAACDGEDDAALEFNRASVYSNANNFIFSGRDSVAHTISFTLMMLSRYTEWQDRAREEILSIIGGEEDFNTSKLSRLKVVGTILNEVMRLFTVAPTITQVAKIDTHLGDLFTPQDSSVELAVQAMHKYPNYWGEDAAEFYPGRFADGVSKACSPPQSFVPFSGGPKNCIAINFAMVEMKIVMSMMLRSFQFLPSLKYKHHPQYGVAQRPKYGMYLILKAL